MDRSIIIALVIFVFLWIVILKYCIETNDWIGNDTIIGLLVGVAWDENLQISELSLSPSENNVNTYLIDTYIMPYFDEYLNVVVYTAL